MDRQFMRVSVSVFRLSSSPTDFNEASKSPDINLKETHYKNSHISRRHASLSEGHLRSSDKDSVIFLLQLLGFLVNQGKSLLMPTQMITNDQIFRSNSRFDSSEIVTYLREVIKNTPFVLENIHGTSGIDFRT